MTRRDPILQDSRQARPVRALGERVVVSLMRSARLVENYWHSYLKRQAGISISQYNILRILRGAHPGVVKTSGIAERMITNDPDVTRLVDRLVRSGLARREDDPSDRRVVLVGITEAGLELLSSLDEPTMRLAAAATAGLSETELEALDELLDLLRSGAEPPE